MLKTLTLSEIATKFNATLTQCKRIGPTFSDYVPAFVVIEWGEDENEMERRKERGIGKGKATNSLQSIQINFVIMTIVVDLMS